MGLQIPAISSKDASAAIDVNDSVFGQVFNETLVHQLVVKYLAGARSGTKSQKTRSEVSGGGIKPWKQKGTGRARSGTSRSPIWRTGGVTFAAKPRNYDQKLNKKMFRVGLRSILSELLRQDRLVVSQDIIPSSIKTKDFATKLADFRSQRVLIVVDSLDENLLLSSRNLTNVEISLAQNLNPAALVSADKVIITPAGIKQIEAQLHEL